MFREFKVLGDFFGEVAHRVRYRGMKPRMKLAVGAQTARPGRCLDHQNALAALREVSRANQPVVSSPDYD